MCKKLLSRITKSLILITNLLVFIKKLLVLKNHSIMVKPAKLLQVQSPLWKPKKMQEWTRWRSKLKSKERSTGNNKLNLIINQTKTKTNSTKKLKLSIIIQFTFINGFISSQPNVWKVVTVEAIASN